MGQTKDTYNFSMRSVHMYNYKVTCTCKGKEYNAICEFAATKESTLLVWIKDFNFPLDEIGDIKISLETWLSSQGIKCVYGDGNRIN